MKSISIATAFAACVMSASPSWGAVPLTEEEMDKVTAGLFFNVGNYVFDFVTVGSNLQNYNVYNGYNFLRGTDFPGILYIDPLPSFLLSSADIRIIR